MSNVKFTGILKLTLSPETVAVVKELWKQLPAEARPLSEENLHVTMMHQNILKPVKKQVSSMPFSICPEVQLEPVIRKIVRPDRTAWIALAKNQDELRHYVESVRTSINETFNTNLVNEDRVFHVSLANLDGSPFASVGDVSLSDIRSPDVLQQPSP